MAKTTCFSAILFCIVSFWLLPISTKADCGAISICGIPLYSDGKSLERCFSEEKGTTVEIDHARYAKLELRAGGALDDYAIVKLSGANEEKYHYNVYKSFTFTLDSLFTDLTIEHEKWDGWFDKKTCSSNVLVRVNPGACTQTEAYVADGSFHYIYPKAIADQPDKGMIIEEEGEEDSKKLLWVYNAFRIGSDICPCKNWISGHSDSQNVWNDQNHKEVEEIYCAGLSGLSDSVETGYSNVFDSSLPKNEWFWFSPKFVGNTTLTDQEVSSSLPGMKLCLRTGLTGKPIVEPSTVLFFDSTANVTISWDEGSFNTSRCGSKQQVNLWYRNSDFGAVKTEYNIEKGVVVSLNNEWPLEFKFLLQMGSNDESNPQIIYGKDCTYLNDNLTLSEDEKSLTEWTVSVEHSWSGSCEDLREHCKYHVVFTALDNIRHNHTNSLDKYYKPDELPESFSFSVFKDFPTSYHLTGFFTVSLYYNDATLISNKTLKHAFCDMNPPTFKNKDPDVEISGNLICEYNESSKGVILYLPDIGSFGRTCADQETHDQVVFDNHNKVYDFTGSSVEVSLGCPAISQSEVYSFTYLLDNGALSTSVKSKQVEICTNSIPDEPGEMLVDNQAVSNGEIHVLDSNVMVLSWSYQNKKWGNCTVYPTPTLQRWFQVNVIKQSVNNWKLTPFGKNEESASMTYMVPFVDGETRAFINWTVVAVRDEIESGGHYINFTACKITPPVAPFLHEFDDTVSEDKEYLDFSWERPKYNGDDCKSKDQTKNGVFTYNLTLFNATTGVKVDEVITENNSTSVNVKRYNGSLTWSVTACIKDSRLCATSGRSTVSIKTCSKTDPSKQEEELIVPTPGKMIYLNNSGDATVTFEWPTPKWGTLCHDKSMKRNMVLNINNNLFKDFPDVDVSPLSSEYTLHDVKNQTYFWYVTAKTVYDGTPRAESKNKTTTQSNFTVCLFTVPDYRLNLNPNSKNYCVVERDDETLPVNLVSGHNDQTCGGDMNVVLKTTLPYAIDKSEFSLEPKEERVVVLPYVLTQKRPFEMTTEISTTLHNVTITKTQTCVVCVPREPPSITVNFTVANSTTGELQANWINWMSEVEETGCSNRPLSFEYNFSGTSGLIKQDSTGDSTVNLKGEKNGLYTIDVIVDNGYFRQRGISASTYFCRNENLGKVSLKRPGDGSSPWYENILFQFGKLKEAEDSCMDVSYTLVLVDNETSRVEIPLSTGTDSYRYRAKLYGNRTYTWYIVRRTSQTGPVPSENHTFTPCNNKPELKEVQLSYPLEGQTVVKKSTEVKFQWALDTTNNNCLLEWNYAIYVAKDSNFTNAISYSSNSESCAIPRLEGNNNNGTTYWWKVSAANIATQIQKESQPRSFKYCECKRPGIPVKTNPMSTVVRANGGYFVSRTVDGGRSCFPENTGTEPVLYKAHIQTMDGTYVREFQGRLTNETITRDGGSIGVRIEPIPNDLPYGIHSWYVTAVNDAGMSTQSDTNEFLVCDYPTTPEINYPKQGDITDHEITFTWNQSSVFFGYPCNRKIKSENRLTVFTLKVNDTTNETEEILQMNLSSTMREWPGTNYLLETKKFNYSCHYRWYLVVSNGETEEKSEEHDFYTNILSCEFITCHNGGKCVNQSGDFVCICPTDFTGNRCQEAKKVNVGLIVGTSVPAFLVFASAVGVAAFLLIRKRKREARKRVTLKEVKYLRFSSVKNENKQGLLISNEEMDKLRERLRDDAENGGFAFSIAILECVPSATIENVCKALLYAHHKDHNDVLLMKALIRKEVSTTVNPDVIFRANTAATLTFKHLSKMVGLNYLFATLGKVVRDVIQKDADDAAVEERMKKDKNLAELMVMQDTCEVDPSKINDQYGQDDLLSINSIQLTLLVQRFVKHIFQSADNMPPELREVMAEVKSTVGSAFPDAVQCALSAFLFLRFFNCGIAVPESYGLLEEPPNERIRRSLVLATKILTTMTSGAHFGEKEEFMFQFEDLVKKNQKELAAFYDAVCSEDSHGEGKSEFEDTPADTYKNSMSVISHYEKMNSGESDNVAVDKPV